MKKILLMILCVALLSGCADMKMKKLGYSKEEIEKISSLAVEHQDYFKEGYEEYLLSLIFHEDFLEENMDEYLKFSDTFEMDKLIALVNSGILNDNSFKKIVSIGKDKCFVDRNESIYFAFMKDFSDTRKLVEYVNSLAYKKQYVDVEDSDLTYGNRVLVNKYHQLSSDYIPKNLVSIDAKYMPAGGMICAEVYEAYKQMYEQAEKDGVSLTINSAYRSYDLQYWTYNNFLKYYSQEEVDTFSAKPGFSEHQTGLALDILSPGYNFDNFDQSEAASWLRKNASKFGFILRYDSTTVDITGYKYEAWHYRYVGDIAEKVMTSGLTYDEYYEVFIR